MSSDNATSPSKHQQNLYSRQRPLQVEIEVHSNLMKNEEIDRISKVIIVGNSEMNVRRKQRISSENHQYDRKQLKQKKSSKHKKHKKSKKKNKKSKEAMDTKIEVKIDESQIEKDQVIFTQKPKPKSKPKVIKPKLKVKEQSINQIQRQFSRISRKKKRKSNFYLDKIDCLKWGIPVGRGAKRSMQKLQKEKQASKINNQQSQSEQKRKQRAAKINIKLKQQSKRKQIIEINDSDHEHELTSDRNLKFDKATQKNSNLLSHSQNKDQNNLSSIDKKTMISEKSQNKKNYNDQKVLTIQ